MRRIFCITLLLLGAVYARVYADNVAQIEGKGEYASLAAAVAAATNGDIITMIADCEVTDATIILKDRTITLDLNGKTITADVNDTHGSLFEIKEAVGSNKGGDLTITDTSEEQTGEIKYIGEHGTTPILIFNGGILTINAGHLHAPSPSAKGNCIVYISSTDAVLTVNGGMLTSSCGQSSNYLGVIDNEGTTTINGGTIENTYAAGGLPGRTIQNNGTKNKYSTLYLNGGNIISNGDAVWTGRYGDLTLGNGVSITGSVSAYGNKAIDKYVLSDNADYSLSSALTVSKVSYDRGTSNAFGTVCLPFVPDTKETITYYTLRETDGNTLTLETVNNVKANTPYVYYTEDGTFSVSREASTTLAANATAGTTQNSDGWQLKGTYKRTYVYADESEGYDESDDSHVLEPNSYYIKDGGFTKADGYFKIKPFRAYFTAPSTGGSNRYEINLLDEATAVQALTDGQATIVSIRNLEGVRLSHPQRGINIVTLSNGENRKVIVK